MQVIIKFHYLAIHRSTSDQTNRAEEECVCEKKKQMGQCRLLVKAPLSQRKMDQVTTATCISLD